jgi:hypothetical protein
MKCRRLKQNREYKKRNRIKGIQYSTAYRHAHREKVLAWQRKHRAKNKDSVKAYQQAYYVTNRIELLKKKKAHQQASRKRINERRRNRYATDVAYRVLRCIRSRISVAVSGKTKSDRTTALLGCSIPFLRGYLSALWEPGMSWENYGEWHIDHKRPCASFDLTDPAQQAKCFHFLNLQPLWASDNLKKSDSFSG